MVSGAQSKAPYSAEDLKVEAALENKALEDMRLKRAAKDERENLLRRQHLEQQLKDIERNKGELDDGLVRAEEEEVSSSVRKRRRASKAVDYVALDKELQG